MERSNNPNRYAGTTPISINRLVTAVFPAIEILLLLLRWPLVRGYWLSGLEYYSYYFCGEPGFMSFILS